MADETATLQEEKKIVLFSAENKDVLVWDADDVFTLRKKYRIVGCLIGSLPRKPKQNIYLSLPLLLSKDETTLLLEKNVACLVESPSSPTLPSQEEVKMFERLRRENVKEQLELFDLENVEKEKEIQSVVEREKKPKKRKGRKRRMKNDDEEVKPEKCKKVKDNDDTSKVVDGDENLEKTDLDKNQEKSLLEVQFLYKEQNDEVSLGVENNPICMTQASANKAKCLGTVDTKELTLLGEHEKQQQTSNTETSSGTDDHKVNLFDFEVTSQTIQLENVSRVSPQEEQESQREKACVIQIPTKMPTCKIKDFSIMQWDYPETQPEQIRFKVFKDLWERGYYITPGTKYGGDFLVYLGDPFKFHSSYVVMVMPPSRKVGMLEMISIGRLAATVKKTAVLATVDGNDHVIYSSVKWSGIS